MLLDHRGPENQKKIKLERRAGGKTMDILRNLRILLWENNCFVLINESIRKGHSKGHEKGTWSQDNTGDSTIG